MKFTTFLNFFSLFSERSQLFMAWKKWFLTTFHNFSRRARTPLIYLFIPQCFIFFQLFLYSVISLLNMLSPGRSLSVRLCVCLSQPFIWTLLDRFRWNLDHMILTKIWDDTFLKFWKCCLNDVITAILMFYDVALSRLRFLCNFLQIHICCSLTHCFVWDCNPAFSVHIFYPKWRLEKQLKIKVT